ncbi:hypothetical protein DAEQUDRAFT_90323 [Daedalea quercina L-15889]|uniref:Uncharacterized protein n=1 Tax=Daedalea quercina L-15889 TaxID=1314783 RepID=A0A165S7M3_9APHY|nr:hypothetical protein DAEQUDRAFT_90323 [Daedalea quercina L-15889]
MAIYQTPPGQSHSLMRRRWEAESRVASPAQMQLTPVASCACLCQLLCGPSRTRASSLVARCAVISMACARLPQARHTDLGRAGDPWRAPLQRFTYALRSGKGKARGWPGDDDRAAQLDSSDLMAGTTPRRTSRTTESRTTSSNGYGGPPHLGSCVRNAGVPRRVRDSSGSMDRAMHTFGVYLHTCTG